MFRSHEARDEKPSPESASSVRFPHDQSVHRHFVDSSRSDRTDSSSSEARDRSSATRPQTYATRGAGFACSPMYTRPRGARPRKQLSFRLMFTPIASSRQWPPSEEGEAVRAAGCVPKLRVPLTELRADAYYMTSPGSRASQPVDSRDGSRGKDYSPHHPESAPMHPGRRTTLPRFLATVSALTAAALVAAAEVPANPAGYPKPIVSSHPVGYKGVTGPNDDISHTFVVLLYRGTPAGTTASEHATRFGGRVRMIFGSAAAYSIKLPSAERAEQFKDALTRDPRVDSVLVNRVYRDVLMQQTNPTNIRRVEAQLSSTVSGDGFGAVDQSRNLAILDTGVSAPDVFVRYARSCIHDANGVPITWDDDGHGSRVASVAAALDDGDGVVGTAPGAPVTSIKMVYAGGGTTLEIIFCGLGTVLDTFYSAGTQDDINVANYSWGILDENTSEDCSSGYHARICWIRDFGARQVAAAGNDAIDFGRLECCDEQGRRQAHIPATYAQVLTVTASADTDARPGWLGADCDSNGWISRDDYYAGFSNYAVADADRNHTIAAVGACAQAERHDGSIATVHGTSFAAPAVAGILYLADFNRCSGDAPETCYAEVRADAQQRSQSDLNYGFIGDPFAPVSNRYYGYLVTADPY